jgi:hypothetical protein
MTRTPGTLAFLTAACGMLGLAAMLSLAALPARAQNGAADVAADLRMAQESEAFRGVANAFVARAQAGDADGTMAMLSKALVERGGEAQIRQALQTQVLPFFQRGNAAAPSRGVTVTRTTDASGQRGFAFYMWLAQRDSSAPRPYTVYVVSEDGRPVVATAVVDRRVEGRHP